MFLRNNDKLSRITFYAKEPTFQPWRVVQEPTFIAQVHQSRLNSCRIVIALPVGLVPDAAPVG